MKKLRFRKQSGFLLTKEDVLDIYKHKREVQVKISKKCSVECETQIDNRVNAGKLWSQKGYDMLKHKIKSGQRKPSQICSSNLQKSLRMPSIARKEEDLLLQKANFISPPILIPFQQVGQINRNLYLHEIDTKQKEEKKKKEYIQTALQNNANQLKPNRNYPYLPNNHNSFSFKNKIIELKNLKQSTIRKRKKQKSERISIIALQSMSRQRERQRILSQSEIEVGLYKKWEEISKRIPDFDRKNKLPHEEKCSEIIGSQIQYDINRWQTITQVPQADTGDLWKKIENRLI